MLRTLPFLLLSCTIAAQVQVGDIAVTGFSANQFGLIRNTTVTGYTTPGFQGSGTSFAHAILADPTNLNVFWLAGDGFLGTATITGTGTSTYALRSNAVGFASQLSWDDTGGVVIADSGTGQVRRFDPTNNNLIDLSTGTQPWGTDLNAGAFDPLTGDVILGGDATIYRLARGTTTATTWITGLGGYVTAIAFDPLTGDVMASVLTVNRIVRITRAGVVSDLSPNGSVPGPNALTIDHNGDWVSGGGTGQVYRIPYAGGAPTFLVNNTSPFGPLTSLAVAGRRGDAPAFGPSCAATAGPTTLRAGGTFRNGSTVTLVSTNHAGMAFGVLILGLDNTSHQGLALPYLLDPVFGTAGCRLNVAIDATATRITPASTPANLSFALQLPTVLAGRRLFAQHACFEPVAGGMAWSNGIALHVF
ncbi:MAG: hypothetical protein IPK26_29400 [Planctomycetes bacterium]|nr:hypothetical protein [Planctomycetota bacterium]